MMLSTDFTNEPAGDARARKQLADHAFCSWRAGGVLFVHERVAARLGSPQVLCPLRFLDTETLIRRADGGTAEPHLRGSRRPTSTTRAAISIAGRTRSILGSLLAEKAKKASLSSS